MSLHARHLIGSPSTSSTLLAPLALTAALCAVLLSGCVSTPKTAQNLTAVDAHALGLGSQNLQTVPDNWWERFGDPQLNEIIALALAHSPSLDEALARVRQVQAQELATSAGNKPVLTFDGQESRELESLNSFYPPRSLGIGPGGGGTYWVGQLGLNLNWNLDFWGRQSSLIKAAGAQAQAAELDRAGARLALSGAIAQAYVDLYRAYALADVANAAELQRKNLQHLAKQRYSAGLDTQIEVSNADALVPQARMSRLQAENTRDIAVHRLAALAGQGADYYSKIQRPHLTLNAVLPLPDALPMDLLAHRPDILAAQARITAATASRAAAKAAFYPDISLHAFAGYQSVGLDKLIEPNSQVYGAGPALHLPIFDGYRLKAGYRGASAELDGAIARYNDTVLSAVRDVSDELSRIDSLTRQQSEAQLSLNAAENAYRLAQNSYKAGLISQVIVLNAESQVLTTRRDMVSIAANLVISRVTLLLNLGGSFQPPANTTTTGSGASS